MTDYDVVICGAGPAGLVLAAALGGQGRRVLLVEKQRHAVEQYKGEVLQPGSQEILAELGLLKPAQDAGYVRAGRLQCADPDGRRLVALDYTRLETPHNYVSVHYYHELQQALGAHLPRTVEMVKGVRVSGLLRDRTGRVTGIRMSRHRQTDGVTACLTVGCEGQGSPSRSDAGLGTGRVRRYSHDLFSFDIADPPPLPPYLTAFVTREGLRLVYPMPHGRARLYVQIPTGGARTIRRAGLDHWLRSIEVATPVLAEVVQAVRRNPGRSQALPARRWVAPDWSVPGLVLIGDAAHSVHPMAGQGMNAAIVDGWILSECLRQTGGGSAQVDAALAEFERRRRPQIAAVARMSHHLALAFTATSRPIQAMSRRMMLKNTDNEAMKDVLTRNMSGLGRRSFTFRDRVHQLGLLPGPRSDRPLRASAPGIGPPGHAE